ncbi:hypothetical protein QYF36_016620 [Acer negundo]|nr:hypothetical protein QYF36_016620 [Acer negundo]
MQTAENERPIASLSRGATAENERAMTSKEGAATSLSRGATVSNERNTAIDGREQAAGQWMWLAFELVGCTYVLVGLSS